MFHLPHLRHVSYLRYMHPPALPATAVIDRPATVTRWQPALPPELMRRTLQAARDTARRLHDRQHVERAIAMAPSQTAYPRTVRWHAPALAQGDAGLALACAYLDACFPGEQWDRAGHGYLASAAEAAERSQLNSPGVFGGLAGLAFAAWALSRGGTRYGRLLSTLDGILLPQLADQAGRLAGVTGEGVAFGEFDAISGAAGAGAILLRRLDVPAVSEALTTICESLVGLTSADANPPRWWTPASLMGQRGHRRALPARQPQLRAGARHSRRPRLHGARVVARDSRARRGARH